jgi:cytoskeleton protein RodZ
VETRDNSPESKKAQFIELGSKLKSLREAQGLLIDDIAQKTKINKRYLTAIEEGRIEALPSGLYVRSFLRQYCEYLSAEDIWHIYDSLTKDMKITQSSIIKAGTAEQSYGGTPEVFKPKSYVWLYVIVAISIGAAVWLTWHYRGDFMRVSTNPNDGGTAPMASLKKETVPAPSSQTPVSPDAAVSLDATASVDVSWMDGGVVTDSQSGGKTAAAVQKKTGEAASAVLKITSSGVVWIKVSQGTSVFFEGLMKQGEAREYEVKGDTPIRVRFGNPAKTTVRWQDKEGPPSQAAGKPLTRYYWPDGRVTEKL